MAKIKIAVTSTTGFHRREGISTILYDYLSEFDMSKFDVSLLVHGAYDENIIKDFENIDVKIKYLPSRKKDPIKYFWCFKRLMYKEHYQIIWMNGSSSIMGLELNMARKAGCKIRIAHSHNTVCSHKKINMILKPLFYLNTTDAFACGIEAGKWLFGNRQFKVLNNGRKLDKFNYDAALRNSKRSELKLAADDFAIGHVGNFSYQKNHEYIICVFEEIIKRKPNAKLFLIGDGDDFEKIQNLVKNKKLDDDVIFLGRVSNVHEILQAMDAMVLPSRYEGLPLVAVEWQISGLPVLMSDVVTDECVFTEFVETASLDDSYSLWAEKIISMYERFNEIRKQISDEAIEEANKSGFNIVNNAKEFQNYLVGK